jgi:hypothetical protein
MSLAFVFSTRVAFASDAVKACEKLKGDLVKMLRGDPARGKTYALAKLAPGGKASFRVVPNSLQWQWVMRSPPIDKGLSLDAEAKPLPKTALNPGVLYTACEFFALAEVGDWKSVRSTSSLLTGDSSRYFLSKRAISAPLAGERSISAKVLPTRMVVVQLMALDEKEPPLVNISLKRRPMTQAVGSQGF